MKLISQSIEAHLVSIYILYVSELESKLNIALKADS